MNQREFDRVINKFGMQVKQTHHVLAWLVHDGKIVVRTRRSQGRKDPPAELVRKQLHLDQRQLADAVECTLGLDAYLGILREKGIL
jgi:hypothetical protein